MDSNTPPDLSQPESTQPDSARPISVDGDRNESAAETADFDIAIAGAGMAGVLMAARLAHAHDNARIVLIEKEPVLGGRLRTSTSGDQGYGLDAISARLFSYLEGTVRLDPAAPDVGDTKADEVRRSIGFFSAGEIKSTEIQSWFEAKGGVRLLGGYSAARQWDDVLAGLTAHAGQEKPMSFGELWTQSRKGPAAVVWEQFSGSLGVSDSWEADLGLIQQRFESLAQPAPKGNWQAVWDLLTKNDAMAKRVRLQLSSQIISANYKDSLWHLETMSGNIIAKRLVVAQPPWAAATWLPRDLWPKELLSFTNKTRPCSVAVMSARRAQDDLEFPDLLLIPAEKIQAHISNDEICFSATLDFEVSLQAPTVAKAVRRLKRSCKKLQKAFPSLRLSDERIALQPYAWTQPCQARDRKALARMAKSKINSDHLCFCGDAYGGSYVGDDNLIDSIDKVTKLYAELLH